VGGAGAGADGGRGGAGADAAGADVGVALGVADAVGVVVGELTGVGVWVDAGDAVPQLKMAIVMTMPRRYVAPRNQRLDFRAGGPLGADHPARTRCQVHLPHRPRPPFEIPRPSTCSRMPALPSFVWVLLTPTPQQRLSNHAPFVSRRPWARWPLRSRTLVPPRKGPARPGNLAALRLHLIAPCRPLARVCRSRQRARSATHVRDGNSGMVAACYR
jgi:hypothetical protein